MAKDDYPVLVYQILSYLYQCLKTGKEINPKMLSVDSDYFRVNKQEINPRYWAYILYNLQKYSLVVGITFADIDNLRYPHPLNWENCMITPMGIEYLTDNSFLSKAKEFLKDTKAIVPFV